MRSTTETQKSYAQPHQPRSTSGIARQKFDYFLVLDFEATCDDAHRIPEQEIIEFPLIKLNSTTFEMEARFHKYVLPDVNPQLTAFCTSLTGIKQDMLDNKPGFEQTMRSFDEWLREQNLISAEDGSKNEVNWTIVTCGDWDLKTQLRQQARRHNYPVPWYFKSWINVKIAYSEAIGGRADKGMMSMLRALNITHQGRHHSGIDDVINICAIVKAIAATGYVFRTTATEKGKVKKDPTNK